VGAAQDGDAGKLCGDIGGCAVTRRVRLVSLLAVVAVLVGAGVFVGWRYIVNGVNHAIPQANLFGDDTPSSSTSPTVTASPTPPPGADIKGPLNILIAGIDTRVSVPGWIPHSDAVMILHVNASLTAGYLTSLPRDLVVDIPPFAPSNFGGSRTKLTHAMSYGSYVPGKSKRDPAQGFALLAKTVSAYTGINHFDAGALVTFYGLTRLVNVMGGIDVYVDQQVISIHRRPDGKYRTVCGGCLHGYTGPQAVYTVGLHHLNGWQALDYSRQRYTAGGDYTRQRHQRQVIKAMIARIFSANIISNPLRISEIIKGLASTLVFDGRGRSAVEFAYALRNIRPDALTLVGLPGGGVYSGGQYIGEALSSIQSSYFAAMRADKLDSFVKANPKLVNPDARS
jgi:polyisoprenyl-teichoic acid--peptidoglycan teichoic acid transferase